jgi:hypothetical protein
MKRSDLAFLAAIMVVAVVLIAIIILHLPTSPEAAKVDATEVDACELGATGCTEIWPVTGIVVAFGGVVAGIRGVSRFGSDREEQTTGGSRAEDGDPE